MSLFLKLRKNILKTASMQVLVNKMVFEKKLVF